MIKIEQLIRAEIKKGIGTEEEPIRIVVQYWTFAGELLFQLDPIEDNNSLASSADLNIERS